MARTTIVIPAAEGFNVQNVMTAFSQIVTSYGYIEKMIKEEPCWSKGDGVIAKQQNFGIVIGQGEILLQGWMNDAITGESDLEGVVAAIPKKKMKNILNELQTQIYQIASVSTQSNAKGLLTANKSSENNQVLRTQERKVVLNERIEEYRELLEKTFVQMGRKYYEEYHDTPADNFCVFVDTVKDYYTQIEEIQKEIAVLENSFLKDLDMVCPECGEPITSEQLFCSNCGRKILWESMLEKREQVCPQCGTAIKENSKFCAMCGIQIRE